MPAMNSKNKELKEIWEEISETFGSSYFTLVDFWDSDNSAFGFTRSEKLVYISNWDSRRSSESGPSFWVEFEIIDESTKDTVRTYKQIETIRSNELLSEVRDILNAS